MNLVISIIVGIIAYAFVGIAYARYMYKTRWETDYWNRDFYAFFSGVCWPIYMLVFLAIWYGDSFAKRK